MSQPNAVEVQAQTVAVVLITSIPDVMAAVALVTAYAKADNYLVTLTLPTGEQVAGVPVFASSTTYDIILGDVIGEGANTFNLRNMVKVEVLRYSSPVAITV